LVDKPTIQSINMSTGAVTEEGVVDPAVVITVSLNPVFTAFDGGCTFKWFTDMGNFTGNSLTINKHNGSLVVHAYVVAVDNFNNTSEKLYLTL